MAYGIEYTLLCNSKKGNLYTAKIYEDGYTDPEIDRNVPINPFRLRKDRSEVVHGTSFEFAIREAVDFEYLKFYTSIPKKFKIELYKASTLLWTGYLNPQQYRAPYKPVPNNIFFMASDGLGLLKEESFTLTGKQSELAIIKHCIDKIGLDLGYAIAIGLWEINHDTSKSVLAQTYLDCDIFEDDNCYEVIEKVLGKYDAEITQWKGRWQIISSKDKKSTRMLYTSAGVYDTTEAAPTVLDMDYPRNAADVYPTEVLTHSLEPGGNKVKSMLKNYLFRKWSSGMFTDWTLGGSAIVSQGFKDGNFYAGLHSNANTDADYIESSIDITDVAGEAFVFEINVCPVAKDVGAYGAYTPVTLEMRMRVTLLVGSTTYYLTSTGWDTTPGIITASILSSMADDDITWTKVKIITDSIPGDGTLTCRLIAAFTTAYGLTDRKATFNEPSVYYLKDGELYDDKLEATAVFDDSVELKALSPVDIAAGDAPATENNSLLYDNITRLSDETPTSAWKFGSGDTIYTLVQAYLKLLASRNRVPRQKLSGNIKGTSIEFNSIIKHAYNSDREFEIADCEWDIYEETLRATLLEILAFSDEDITVTDEDGTVTEIAGDANLTVASVSLGTNPVAVDQTFNITVHVDNTGDLPGQNTIEWKIVNGSDETQTSGTHASQVIAAGEDDDDTFEVTAPDTVGSYTVKCRMSSDTAWVSSGTLTVSETEVAINSIQVIPVGVVDTPLSLTFNATNSGPAGRTRDLQARKLFTMSCTTKTISWFILVMRIRTLPTAQIITR